MAHLYQTIFHRHHLYKFEEDDKSNTRCIYHIMLENVFKLLSKKNNKNRNDNDKTQNYLFFKTH